MFEGVQIISRYLETMHGINPNLISEAALELLELKKKKEK